MSEFLPDAPYDKKKDGKPSDEAPPDYLTPQERQALQRQMGYPEDLPKKFKSWILDYIAVNGLDIPVSQMHGFIGFRPKIGTASDTSATSSSSYVDVGAARLSSVEAGQYLFIYGFQRSDYSGGSPTGPGYISPSFNGSTPADGVAAVSWLSIEGAVYFTTFTLDQGSNEVILKAKTGGSAERDFAGTFIIALKIGN